MEIRKPGKLIFLYPRRRRESLRFFPAEPLAKQPNISIDFGRESTLRIVLPRTFHLRSVASLAHVIRRPAAGQCGGAASTPGAGAGSAKLISLGSVSDEQRREHIAYSPKIRVVSLLDFGAV